jgi:hypothetical protein
MLILLQNPRPEYELPPRNAVEHLNEAHNIGVLRPKLVVCAIATDDERLRPRCRSRQRGMPHGDH